MQPDNPQGESAAVVTPEPSAAPQAPGSDVNPQQPVNEQPSAEAPKAEDIAALQKELEKIRMENNLHKNKLEKFEKEKEEARKAQLTREEQLAEELASYKAKEAHREAEAFRSSVIDEYLANDPVALKAAKALIAKNPSNLTWGAKEDGGGPTEDEARADLHAQLDALKEVLGTTQTPAPEKPAPSVHANNPGRTTDEVDPERAQLVAEAHKTGDWKKVLSALPSVKFQNSRED